MRIKDRSDFVHRFNALGTNLDFFTVNRFSLEIYLKFSFSGNV